MNSYRYNVSNIDATLIQKKQEKIVSELKEDFNLSDISPDVTRLLNHAAKLELEKESRFEKTGTPEMYKINNYIFSLFEVAEISLSDKIISIQFKSGRNQDLLFNCPRDAEIVWGDICRILKFSMDVGVNKNERKSW